MDTSVVTTYLTIIVIEILLAWGVGGFFSAVGKIRGWNTTRTFWAVAIGYLLFVVGIYQVGLSASGSLGSGDPLTIALVSLCVLAGIGALSPIGNLALRAKYPDAFRKSILATTTPVSETQGTPQKPQPARAGNQPRSQVEAVVRRLIPRTGTGHIFVSYRRSDSADVAGRVYDRLVGKFGKGPIFKDVDSIPLGVDFKEYLNQKVSECTVLVAIIGDQWLDVRDSTGQRRLDDPSDFVRIEIESALRGNIPVIPLLVRGAQMPSEESLPVSLRNLVYRNGIPIRSDPDFHRDMDRLISGLEQYVW